MSKSDLLQISGIGESTADALVKSEVTTPSNLKRVLQNLEPPARHLYSTFQLSVLAEFDLPTIGNQTVSKYTRETFSEEEIVYEWERKTGILTLKMIKEGDVFRAEWRSDSEDRPLRSERYDQRSDAIKALTRWAYRPPEFA